MEPWENWSGSISHSVNQIMHPGSLRELIRIAADPTIEDTFIHAEGSRWAFSAPAYCEHIIISTDNLNDFSKVVQQSVNPSEDPNKLRFVVEAGIKIRHLYTALAGRLPQRLPSPGGRSPPGHLPPGAWTLPTLGGAGGQSIAGAISTGTHGGDVARPPLSDAVSAMLMVGSNGELRLLQRPASDDRPPVVDVQRLSAILTNEFGEPVTVTDLQNSAMLDAAVVSTGRFGIVYAYVLEAVNEAGQLVIQDRTKPEDGWNGAKTRLLMDVANARANNGFFQIVINPHKRDDGNRTCYVTSHSIKPDRPDLSMVPPWDPAEIPHVNDARRGSGGVVTMLAGLCGTTITPELANIRNALYAAAAAGVLFGVPLAIAAVPAIIGAADSLGRIGSEITPGGRRHLLGDAVADVLNMATRHGFPQITENVTAAMLDGGQPVIIRAHVPPTVPNDITRPWMVKGTRFEIADFFDYDNDCYRGDSVELFFEVNEDLPAKIDRVLDVFDVLRREDRPIGAYVSLRFMARSRATLGLARWNTSCSVEIAMLRGLLGNPRALRLLQQVALENDGLVHWGQQNDLTQAQVEARFGNALSEWRVQLEALEGDSMLFSTPFTRQHGLEVQLRAPDWGRWDMLDLSARSSPCVAPAWNDQPLEIFSKNGQGMTFSRQRRIDGTPDGAWTAVHDDQVQVDSRPVVHRSIDGRLELFVLDEMRIKHRWQEGGPGGQWSSWDTLGHGTPTLIHSDPTVTAHNDGRLELFARGEILQLIHCWAHWTNGPWSDFKPRGPEAIVNTPSSCHRNWNNQTDQILVVALSQDGRVLEKHQHGPGHDTGWTEWAEIQPSSGGPTLRVGGGSPIAVDVIEPAPVGHRVHVFIIDSRGRVHEILEELLALELSWAPWQSLPPTAAVGRLAQESRLTTVQTDRLYLFGKSLRGQAVVCEFRPGIGWGNWQNLGGEFAGDIAAGAHADGRIEVVAHRASDNQLMARRQTSAGVW